MKLFLPLFLAVAATGTQQFHNLAIDFHLDQNARVISVANDFFYCIKLTLRPEDDQTTRNRVSSEVEEQWELPVEIPADDREKCNEVGGVYISFNHLQKFVNNASQKAVGAEVPSSRKCSALTSSPSCNNVRRESELEEAIANWNDRWFNMDTVHFRPATELFHGVGSEQEHLAYEVTLFTMPEELQQRISQRLFDNHELFFSSRGAGVGGTTGASFLAGNVGFGDTKRGASVIDVLFPPAEGKDLYSEAALSTHEGDQYAIARGGMLFGETTSKGGVRNKGIGDTTSPDLQLFEEVIKENIMARADVQQLYHGDVDFQVQHRLWRYGPDFDASKGGKWHKDTCPFGINGALPKDAIMFTLVYILYTENLDLPTAGTRVKDMHGMVHQLPCEAGKGNMIRSGEDDQYTFLHAGPLQMKKADSSKPAFRVMMQSKILVLPAAGRQQTFARKGNWRGLKIDKLESAPSAEANKPELSKWLHSTSSKATAGVAESNALGSSAYPPNVHRAWAVTWDLSAFLGFKTWGFMPNTDKPQSPVYMFGFDYWSHHIYQDLETARFRVTTVAPDELFGPLKATDHDKFSNMHTLRFRESEAVRGEMSNEPFDMHILVDMLPESQLSANGTDHFADHIDPVLRRYGDFLVTLATDKAPGEGRLASVTYLSQVASVKYQVSRRQAEREWTQFGEQYGVRIVIMRVAHRVYGPENSALVSVDNPENDGARVSPCRSEPCSTEQPLTRIHVDDLSGIIKRMISMFDIVEVHGRDLSMTGTASYASSIKRFPSGKILNLVDDGPYHSMEEVEHWCAIVMGKTWGSELCDGMCPYPHKEQATPPEFSNEETKRSLGYQLKYASYRHGAAMMFAAGEFKGMTLPNFGA